MNTDPAWPANHTATRRTAKNDTAFSQNTHSTPNAPLINDARSGPITRASELVAVPRLIALVSPSRGTTAGVSACWAGIANMNAIPRKNESAAMFTMVAAPVDTITPNTIAPTICRQSPSCDTQPAARTRRNDLP